MLLLWKGQSWSRRPKANNIHRLLLQMHDIVRHDVHNLPLSTPSPPVTTTTYYNQRLLLVHMYTNNTQNVCGFNSQCSFQRYSFKRNSLQWHFTPKAIVPKDLLQRHPLQRFSLQWLLITDLKCVCVYMSQCVCVCVFHDFELLRFYVQINFWLCFK